MGLSVKDKIVSLKDLLAIDNNIKTHGNIYEDITSNCTFAVNNFPEMDPNYTYETTGIHSGNKYYNKIYSTTLNVQGGDHFLVYGWDYFYGRFPTAANSTTYTNYSTDIVFYTNPVEYVISGSGGGYTRYFLGFPRSDVERFNTNASWIYKSLEFIIPPSITQIKIYDFTECVSDTSGGDYLEGKIFKII